MSYGTDKSEMLLDLINAGFKPVAITIMVCEETFVFQKPDELGPAIDWANANGWANEGWWYSIEDEGEWPWEKARKDYVKSNYDGDESAAPKVYWIDYNKIKTVKEFLKK